jgi:hypothetical protein
MSIDGYQKHSKAVENTGRNCFSTLAGTLDILSPGCCLPQAEVARKIDLCRCAAEVPHGLTTVRHREKPRYPPQIFIAAQIVPGTMARLG